MAETPTLNDIDQERSREIGETIRDLSVGDVVRVTNNRRDEYVEGEVTELFNGLEMDREVYTRHIEDDNGVRYEIHVNWADIPPNADDQKTPYTGLLEEPWNDTAPSVTDIEVIEESE